MLVNPSAPVQVAQGILAYLKDRGDRLAGRPGARPRAGGPMPRAPGDPRPRTDRGGAGSPTRRAPTPWRRPRRRSGCSRWGSSCSRPSVPPSSGSAGTGPSSWTSSPRHPEHRRARCSRNCAWLVEILTVHALGGGGDDRGGGPRRPSRRGGGAGPTIAAVTVLSSLGGESLASPASLAFEAMSAGPPAPWSPVTTCRSCARSSTNGSVHRAGIRPAGSNGYDQVRVSRRRRSGGAGHSSPADRRVAGSRTARTILSSVR